MNLAEIGEELRNARKGVNLSQAELAWKARMSRTTISLLERGMVSDLGVRKIQNLCDFLGMQLEVTPRRPAPLLHEVLAANDLERRVQLDETDKLLENL